MTDRSLSLDFSVSFFFFFFSNFHPTIKNSDFIHVYSETEPLQQIKMFLDIFVSDVYPRCLALNSTSELTFRYCK